MVFSHLGEPELEWDKRFCPWVLQGNRSFWTPLTHKEVTVCLETQSSGEVQCLPLSALSSPICLFSLFLFVLSAPLVSPTLPCGSLILYLICITLTSLSFPASFSGVFLSRLTVLISLLGFFIPFSPSVPYMVSFSATPSAPAAHKSISCTAI